MPYSWCTLTTSLTANLTQVNFRLFVLLLPFHILWFKITPSLLALRIYFHRPRAVPPNPLPWAWNFCVACNYRTLNVNLMWKYSKKAMLPLAFNISFSALVYESILPGRISRRYVSGSSSDVLTIQHLLHDISHRTAVVVTATAY